MATGSAEKWQQPSFKAISRAVAALTTRMTAEPEDYRISLRIVPEPLELVAECLFTVRTTKPCDRVPVLLGQDLQITGLSVDGAPAQSERGRDLVLLSLGKQVGAGTQIKLALRYRGTLPPAYLVRDGQDVWIELHPIAFWYPLVGWNWDFSRLTPFRLECWLPEHLVAVANGTPVASIESRSTWESRTGSPLIALLAGPYVTHTLSHEGYTVGCYGRPELAAQLPGLCEQAVRIAALYADAFGPLSDRRLDIVIPPQSVGGNWALDDMVVAAQMRADNAARNFGILTHEIGHRWWGRAVQIDFNRDIWLVEGLTEFSALRATYEVKGEEETRRHLAEWTLPRYADARAAGIPLAACRPDSPASMQLREDAAAILLTQLRARLGRGEFDRRLRRFCREHLGKIATTTDFERVVLLGVSDEVRQFVRRWVQEPGLPEVGVEEVLVGLR